MTIDNKYIKKRVWLSIHQRMPLNSAEKKKLLGRNWGLNLHKTTVFLLIMEKMCSWKREKLKVVNKEF